MGKLDPYLTLSTFAALGAFELENIGPFRRPTIKEVAEVYPPKKCLLDGCDKNREGNKLFCCREHFGKYQQKKGKK
jgi:hypothetical protein